MWSKQGFLLSQAEASGRERPEGPLDPKQMPGPKSGTACGHSLLRATMQDRQVILGLTL